MRRKHLTWRISMMIFVLPGFLVSRVIQAQQEKETTKSEGATSTPAFSGRPVQKIFNVKFADVDKLAETLRLFGPVFSNRELKVITVSGSPELVAAVEDAIKRFERPFASLKKHRADCLSVSSISPSDFEHFARSLMRLSSN